MAKGKKTGGRRKGTPNKVTATVKAGFLEVFNTIGEPDGIDHVEYLRAWARAHPGQFYLLASKLIPQEVAGDPEQPLVTKVIFGGRYRQDGP